MTEQVTIQIPTDPNVLLQIKKGLQEVEASKIRGKAETDLQTEIFNKLAEETGVPNRFLRKLATAQAEGGVDKLIREVEDVEALYVVINRPVQAILADAKQEDPLV